MLVDLIIAGYALIEGHNDPLPNFNEVPLADAVDSIPLLLIPVELSTGYSFISTASDVGGFGYG